MKIIKPFYEILDLPEEREILKKIELCGRVCYKSEGRITEDSGEAFVRNLIRRGHESVLEHAVITVKFTVDRGVSHEIVRHRLAAFSQESTRYCNYSKGDFGGEITVIEPLFLERGTGAWRIWERACMAVETAYFDLLGEGLTPQQARSVLPNSLKTELIVTANLREWRHILRLRTAPEAHPQMREVMVPLLAELRERLPAVFGDIGGDNETV